MMSRFRTRQFPPWGALVLILPLIVMAGPASGDDSAEPAPVVEVDSVDISRYVGLWYEVAKIPNRFQDHCVSGTTAEYTLRKDGRLEVVNRCLEDDGSLDEAEGVAKIEDTVTNAKLKVSFVSFLGWRPFWGDYWVIGLDEGYSWAIVGTPDRKYGWVLARTPELDEAAWAGIDSVLADNGYQKEAFEMSPH